MISTWVPTVLSTGIALSASWRAVRFCPTSAVPVRRGPMPVRARYVNHRQKSFLTSGLTAEKE